MTEASGFFLSFEIPANYVYTICACIYLHNESFVGIFRLKMYCNYSVENSAIAFRLLEILDIVGNLLIVNAQVTIVICFSCSFPYQNHVIISSFLIQMSKLLSNQNSVFSHTDKQSLIQN